MFVCLYADVISAGVQLTDQGCFTREDVTVARKWIAHTILTGVNTNDPMNRKLTDRKQS